MAYPPFHPQSGRAPEVLSLTELREWFSSENEYVELKAGTGNQPLQDAIVAFSNADGGVIVVGVRDDGSVVGRELNQGTLDAINQAFRDVRDPGRFAIHAFGVNGTPLVAIGIASRVNGFAQTSNGRVLVRRGSHEVSPFGDELRRLLVGRSLERFEDHPSGTAREDADGHRIARVAEVFGWDPAEHGLEDRLHEQGLLTADGRELTIAGVGYLLSDPAEVLGKAYVEILRFPAGRDYDRRIEIRGPFDQQVRDATRTVADELGHELVVVGLQRHEIPRLPVVVLREAIANAVAHRSYEDGGTSIRIEIRLDEVVIISPGGLPEPVTEENIRVARAARNLKIIRVLRRAGLAEDAGRGIDVIEDGMRSELLDPPSFRDLGHAVRVALPMRSAVAPDERAWVREVEARGLIEAPDRMILVHAARGETVTNARVRELLKVDSRDARRALKRLSEAGLLTRRGERGGATYVLADSIAVPAGLRLTSAELAELLLEMVEEEPLTNAKVRLRTGLDRAQALRVLDELVQAGRLVRVGQRRGSRYLPAEPPENAA